MVRPKTTDLELMNCGNCNKPVETKWAYSGDQCLGLERGDYELWGDCIICLPCVTILEADLERINGQAEEQA